MKYFKNYKWLLSENQWVRTDFLVIDSTRHWLFQKNIKVKGRQCCDYNVIPGITKIKRWGGNDSTNYSINSITSCFFCFACQIQTLTASKKEYCLIISRSMENIMLNWMVTKYANNSKIKLITNFNCFSHQSLDPEVRQKFEVVNIFQVYTRIIPS